MAAVADYDSLSQTVTPLQEALYNLGFSQLSKKTANYSKLTTKGEKLQRSCDSTEMPLRYQEV